MTSIAAGDGAQLGPAAENLGRRRAAGIYGAIITAAILDTVGGHASTTVLVISVVVTLLVYWIAEEYAEVLGEHTAGGRLPSRASIQGALAATWPMVSASYAPLLAVVLATLAGAGDVVATDRPHVGALRRAEGQRDPGAAGGGDGEPDESGGLADGVAQQVSGDAVRRGLVALAGSVQADHGVEVDDATRLVFGHLDEPDSHQGAEQLLGDAEAAGQVPGQVGDEPAPQVGRAGVEQHGCFVVVAVRAHRLTEPGIGFGVPGGQEMSRPCGQRRALWSRRGRQGGTVLPRIRRE